MPTAARSTWTAERIRELRTRLNLSQREFGLLLSPPILGPRAISNWENGRSRPALYYDEQFEKLAKTAA